ncbi:hypothetical protein N7510_011045 [Penicillium lagena]|uniref:uncharacterized protein n=1 Tax=Penicillium lagena TaxID=94218 RepID=UPI002541A096|nr:uncharacterized protein N7510_011045 [Penicillium lagena]KAJ5601511.1 hypothetical protein N7510_011045 [Penicillium lagena]
MPHTKRACYDRTRLYWLVYLCDHHSSLSHGRPPLTRDFQSLRKPREFLQSYFTNPSDLTLISQVEMWSLSSKVFDMFGADIEWHVASQRGAELAQLSNSYERWSEEWLDMLSFGDPSTTNTFSCRVFDLYFHSAKLYLYSHIFRGPSPEEDTRSKLSAESTTGVNRFVQGALKSALSIVRCIVDNTQPWPWLETLPVYLGAMTAFACVVLVKASRHQGVLSQDMLQTGVDVPGYLRRLVQVLRASPVVDSPTHPLLNIARSLEVATNGEQQQEHSHQTTSSALSWDYIPDLDMDFGCFDLFTNEEALDSSVQGAVFTEV